MFPVGSKDKGMLRGLPHVASTLARSAAIEGLFQRKRVSASGRSNPLRRRASPSSSTSSSMSTDLYK